MLRRTSYYQSINVVFGSMIHMKNNYYQLFITYIKAFYAYLSLETRGALLDMSKAFDKIWYQGLIFKLKSTEISDSILRLIECFLRNSFQSVLLNGHTSEWLPVKAGVPKGSIFSPVFFLIYLNDLCDDIVSTVKVR